MPAELISSEAQFKNHPVDTRRLMEQIAAPENLLAAWRSVRGNIPRYRRMRSAGPDGVTLEEFERDLPAHLGALRQMLLKGRYQPQPPALFKVRKPSGGDRRLAVLSVADRVAQRAAQQELEPIWEPSFLPCSFGFRPGLSTHQAVEMARSLRSSVNIWCVDGDIAACFDSLDHQLLVKRVELRVRDPRVIELLTRWLEQGILEHGTPAPATNPLAAGWEKISGSLLKGTNWVLDTVNGSEDEYPSHPYRIAPPGENEFYPEDFEYAEGLESAYLPPARRDPRKNALQQMNTSGLMLGAGYARPALSRLGSTLLAGLKTHTGRQILKRSALAGGGVVGAAIGVGAAALLLYRELAPAPVGILQGNPLSPLLANIYLHPFDLHMTRESYHLVRFADDWVVCCPSELVAERASG